MRSVLATVFSLVMLVMIMGPVANAQGTAISKGSLQLSGGLTFTSLSGDLYENGDGDGMTVFGINPGINYFVSDGLALGGRLFLEKTSRGDLSSTGVGIGPQLTYFFNMDKSKSGKGTLYPFLGTAFLYSTEKYDDGVDDSKVRFTTFALDGGLMYMVSGSVALFGQLEYDMDSAKQTKPEGESVSGSGLGIFTGFTYFIF